MPDFKTEQDVEAFVTSHAGGLGRMVLALRLADGRLDGPDATLARQWLRRHPGPGEPMPAGEPQHMPARPDAAERHGMLVATVAGLFGFALLVGSAWLPVGWSGL